jgi:hypothetical protein
MKSSRFPGIVALLGILTPAIGGGGPTEKPAAAQHVLWGGVGIFVDAGPSGVKIELDAAQGRIERPLALDDAGRFDMEGTLSREHPGPTRQGEGEPAPEPARYRGTIERGTLTLRITLTRSGTVIGPLTARQGSPARLRKLA